VNTGTNAADSAACANRFAIRFGICDANVKAEGRSPVPNTRAAMISRARPTTRDSAVAAAKIAVLTERRRRWLSSVAAKGRYSTAPLMANIHSQKKRIERALRERDENRRYTSRIKTYFRRLEAAVAAGDDAAADAEHRTLVQTIDKAVKRGSLHKNNGARKKSRASRVRRGAAAE